MGGEKLYEESYFNEHLELSRAAIRKHGIKAVGAHRVNGESLSSRDRSKVEVRISQTSGCRGVGEGGVENDSDFRAG